MNCNCLPGDGFCNRCGATDDDWPPFDPEDRPDPVEHENCWPDDYVTGLVADYCEMAEKLEAAYAEAKAAGDRFCEWWAEDTLKAYDNGYACGYAAGMAASIPRGE